MLSCMAPFANKTYGHLSSFISRRLKIEVICEEGAQYYDSLQKGEYDRLRYNETLPLVQNALQLLFLLALHLSNC